MTTQDLTAGVSEIDAATLRRCWDWSRVKPDMVDRVIRAIEMQSRTISACCGPFRRHSVIVWCNYGGVHPLCANNFTLRHGVGDVDEGESVLAVPVA